MADRITRVRCATCNGTGKVPFAGKGPWAHLSERSCTTCRGKGWHKPGDEFGRDYSR